MNIACGKRRLVSYRYGWKIEIEKTSGKGKKHWTEDSPAYPANLAQALEMVAERELTDGPDTDINGLVDALKQASHAVRVYAKQAREAA